MTCYLYMIVQEPPGIHGRMTLKIGIASNIQDRLASLQTGNPCELYVGAKWELPSRQEARRIEREIHADLINSRIRGEWFHVSPVGVMCTVDEILGIAEE